MNYGRETGSDMAGSRLGGRASVPERDYPEEVRPDKEIPREIGNLMNAVAALESLVEVIAGRTEPVRSSQPSAKSLDNKDYPCSSQFAGTLHVLALRIQETNHRLDHILSTLELP